jgi:hypothetical protein
LNFVGSCRFSDDKTGLAKQKAHSGDLIQLILQKIIGINGEISGNDREVCTFFDIFTQKFSN